MRSFVTHSVILLVICAAATSVPTVPLKRIRSSGAYLKGTADAVRARAAFLKGRRASGPTITPATDLGYFQYTANVGMGSPPEYYSLIIDSGSSNTVCGTGIPYYETSTTIPTGETFAINYASGNVARNEILDQVTLSPGLVIANQSIGEVFDSSGFDDVDGVLGIGPVDLTKSTLSPDVNATIPTIMDNLVSQGLINSETLGVYFAPPNYYTDTNGALTFGGVDESLYQGELTYAPLTDTLPAARFWGINVTSASYGNITVIPASTAGIVDTGTTQVLLADDFFNVYLGAIPGAQSNSTTGLIEIPSSSVSSMQPLNFEIAGVVFSLSIAAQLFPMDENTGFGGDPSIQYGVVGGLGSLSGQGFDFILGQMFMERYYVVFDASTTPARVGFAQTNNTFST